MSKAKSSVKKKTGGVPSRKTLYVKVAGEALEAIRYLAGVMKGNRKPNAVRVGAAKSLLAKALPDLKATELSGLDGQDLKLVINVVEGKIDGSQSGDKEL